MDLLPEGMKVVRMFPERLPVRSLWQLEASQDHWWLDQGLQGLCAPQRLQGQCQSLLYFPLLSLLCPPIWLHVTPLQAHRDLQVFSQRRFWQKEVEKGEAVICVTGQNGQ